MSGVDGSIRCEEIIDGIEMTLLFSVFMLHDRDFYTLPRASHSSGSEALAIRYSDVVHSSQHRAHPRRRVRVG